MTEDRVALLRAPAARAAARVALNLLDAAHAAEQRVRERTDDEALHDFRVALDWALRNNASFTEWLGYYGYALTKRTGHPAEA